MANVLITLLVLSVFLGPIILTIILIRRIRKRKQREARSGFVSGVLSFHGERLRDCPVTVALLLILSAIFLGELQFGVEPASGLTPTVLTLGAWGGNFRQLTIGQGEWYRIFTAGLLHGSFEHILFNGVALYFAGRIFENLAGRAWFFAIFFLSCAAGSLASLAINPPNMISVGASGGIMGLFAAIFTTSFRIEDANRRTSVQVDAMRVLIPSLLPFLGSATEGEHIDYGAHMGGAIAGGLCGLLMIRTWNRAEKKPGLRGLALIVAVAGAITFTGSMSVVLLQYASFKKVVENQDSLIPSAEMPHGHDEIAKNAAALLKKYPKDPRSHMFYAGVLMTSARFAEAETELRISLRQVDDLGFMFNNQATLKITFQSLLAIDLQAEDKKAEALREAEAPCHADPAVLPPLLKEKLVQAHLCTGQ